MVELAENLGTQLCLDGAWYELCKTQRFWNCPKGRGSAVKRDPYKLLSKNF